MRREVLGGREHIYVGKKAGTEDLSELLFSRLHSQQKALDGGGVHAMVDRQHGQIQNHAEHIACTKGLIRGHTMIMSKRRESIIRGWVNKVGRKGVY